jgi:hypothetical protein
MRGKMKTEIANIKAQIKALYLKESAQDFSEAWGEIRDYGNDFDDEAQEEMDNKAQKAADDFGGGVSARELAED